jgi:octaprenyl-diphosphate synthase
MNFENYLNSVRDEIIAARKNAFKGPSLVPHADVFSEIIEYDGKSIGKLIRPFLCVLVNDALGGEHAEAVHIGAAIELVHGGSLVHDDIIDEDEERRGNLTVWKQFGTKPAVLFGDILFVASATATRTLPDNHMSKSFREVMEIYGRASSGAMMEAHRNPFDFQEYLNIIKLKTAAMFRGAARLGCITSNAGEDVTFIMSSWAEDIGVAFQIEDDIADIRKTLNDKLPVGDVKEGKSTLPLILLKQKYPVLEKQCEVFINGVEDLEQIAGITAMIPEGITLAEKYIEDIIRIANYRLDMIPFKDSFKDILKEYGHYIIDSMRKEN